LQIRKLDRAAAAALGFIERTVKRIFAASWEVQFDRHGTVALASGFEGAVVQSDVRDALRDLARHTVWLGKRPSEAYRVLVRSDCARYLQLLGEETAKQRKRYRKSSKRAPTPLTPAQIEAMQLVAEYDGDFTAAGSAAGKSRQAMRKLYNKACEKLGKSTVLKAAKTQALPLDHRGQVNVPDSQAQLDEDE
jgi:hypothetical protein